MNKKRKSRRETLLTLLCKTIYPYVTCEIQFVPYSESKVVAIHGIIHLARFYQNDKSLGKQNLNIKFKASVSTECLKICRIVYFAALFLFPFGVFGKFALFYFP